MAMQDNGGRRIIDVVVAISDADHPGKASAWATKADPHGGARVPGVLIADTLDRLREILTAGLTRRERTAMMPAGVLEAWD